MLSIKCYANQKKQIFQIYFPIDSQKFESTLQEMQLTRVYIEFEQFDAQLFIP